jgi:beta-galactosidase
MPAKHLPAFPYGAVYFRWSNPPKEDWERDYKTAAEDGMNIFRHWIPWSVLEQAPGRFVWDALDLHLDLAAKNGIKTILSEWSAAPPEWAYRKYDHARVKDRDGRKGFSTMSGSCNTGGFGGLCLDNDDFREAAGNYMHQLASHCKGNPGLGGYDIWNECNMSPDLCYCPGTVARFREWLNKKYGDLKTLGEAWFRPSCASWEDVIPPRQLGPFPDVMDWIQFRIDNAYELMRWRVETIRSVDPDCAITAHGIAASLHGLAHRVADDWRAAAEVESYGYTWGSSRHGDEPWKQFHAVDLVRASSRGKKFWHAEAYGGPLWMQPNVVSKPRDEGRICYPEDIRYWNLASYMCGATGTLFLRWRPLLEGPLFGAFGPYGMDGSRTDRSEMSARVAKWAAAPEQKKLWRSRPIKGELGIVFVPESQIHSYALQGHTDFFASSMRGAYQGFFDLNVQADWIRIDHIDEYDLLYLPFPAMLSFETAAKLKAWVKAGGKLICEGCPAYFGDRGRVGTVQPNYGLDEVFGCRESYVEFTPDLLGDLELNVSGTRTRGGLFLQAYEPKEGTEIGWYDDGRVAAVENSYGTGKTLLVGTMVGYGYDAHPEDRSPQFFADTIVWAGKSQHVVSSDPRVKARIHDGEGGTYLWVANPKRQNIPVRIIPSHAWGPYKKIRTLWGSQASMDGRTIVLTACARDVTVLALE